MQEDRNEVIYVAVNYPKLSETFVCSEVQSLRDFGQAVTVLAGRADPGATTKPVGVLYAPSIPSLRHIVTATVMFVHSAQWATSAIEAIKAWWLAWRLLGVAKRLRPRQLHAHFATSPTLTAAVLGRALDVPVTATFHANDYLVGVSPRALARRTEQLSAVFAISEAARDEIRVRGSCPVEKIHVVRAGIVHSLMSRAPHEGPRDDEIVVVARLVRKKGIDRLLRAFAQLTSADCASRLVIVGDGPERASLRLLSQDLGIADQVDFLGSQPHAVALDRVWSASVAALTAVVDDGDADGIPVFLMEAAAAALPIVTTAVGGVPELIEDGVSGLLVDADDPADVAAGLARAMSEDGPRLGRAAREMVLREFNPRLQSQRLVTVWTQLADSERHS